MFVTKSHKKKTPHCYVNVIHMNKFAVCTRLASLLVNYCYIYCAFVVTQWLCLVCSERRSCTWLGNSLFDSKHLYNVLLLTCSILFIVIVDSWNVQKISNMKDKNSVTQTWHLIKSLSVVKTPEWCHTYHLLKWMLR